jgi:hypothetical protein
MGRPNQCNPCCGNAGSGGSGGSEEPQISDCEKVICVAIIDDTARSDVGANSFNQKMYLWRLAYPDRLLFVLDVQAGLYEGSVSYPSTFISWPKAFSLKLEYNKFYGGLIKYMKRDYGNTYTADQNDPWQRIKTIVNHYGGDVLQSFNSSREVAIFVDDSGSMTAIQVEATVEKLKQDARSDHKIIVSSISNRNEDIICPFVQTSCNTGEASQTLRSLCGL